MASESGSAAAWPSSAQSIPAVQCQGILPQLNCTPACGICREHGLQRPRRQRSQAACHGNMQLAPKLSVPQKGRCKASAPNIPREPLPKPRSCASSQLSSTMNWCFFGFTSASSKRSHPLTWNPQQKKVPVSSDLQVFDSASVAHVHGRLGCEAWRRGGCV